MVASDGPSYDFEWDEPTQPEAFGGTVSTGPFIPEPARPVHQLARFIWPVWTPWLAILWVLAMPIGRPSILQGPATIALMASWIATGIAEVAAAYAFRNALERRAPSVISAHGIGYMGSTTTQWGLLRAARDPRVQSDPELAEYGDRARGLQISSTVVFFAFVAQMLLRATLLK